MKRNTKFIIGMATAFAAAGVLASCGSKKYKINFITNGGSGVDSIEVDWGEIPTLPESPTQEGYTFVGWYTDAGLTNPYVAAAVETDITLYGKWSINSYNVIFSTGVEGLEVPAKTFKYGAKIEVNNEITRDYYTFGGWYYDTAFEKEYNPNDSMPGHDVTFYAKWLENSFTITFNANNENATGSMEDFKVKETLESKKLPANKFKVVGMDFLGWSTTPDGAVEYVDGQDLLHAFTEEDFTLYAVWGVKSVNVAFLTLNSEGVLEPMKDVPEVKYGETVQAPAAEPSMVGFNFGGWGNMQPTTDTKANFGKIYYTALDGSFIRKPVVADEDITGKNYYEVAKVELANEKAKDNSRYFALFTRKESKVHFVESIDGVVGEEIAVTNGYYDSSVSFTEVTKPVKAGYLVGAWYHDVECKRMVAGTGVTYGEEDVTVYLQYVHNKHTLRYSVDGGNSFTSVARYLDEDLNLPMQTKVGYNFLGWSTSKDSVELYDGKMPDSDLDLFAVFEQKTYTIKLHGATGVYTQSYKYGETLNLGTASKTGYEFGGWYTEEACVNRFSLTAMPDNENIELYAKFIANKHQISFETNGGNTIATIVDVEFDKPLKDLSIANPTKVGYAFVKWVDGSGNEVDLATAKMPNNDLKLYAVYSAQAVNVDVVYKGQDLGASTYSNLGTDKTTGIADQDSFTISADKAKAFTGFVYEKSDTISVKANGTSVINVYYTRATMKVTFDDGETSKDVNVLFGGKVSAVPEGFSKTGYKAVFKVGDKEVDLADLVIEADTTIAVEYVALPQSITFNANGGLYNGKVSDYVEYATDATVTLPGADVTTRDGYTLLGWSTTSDGEVITDTYTMPAQSVTLYAIWQVNQYTINFISEQGTAPTSITADYGSEVTLPSISATGYTFNGYKDAKDADVAAGKYIMPLGGADLTAQWIENSVKVVFHGNGSTTGSMADQTITYSGSKALAQNAFAKTGHSFAGWATTENGEAVYADKASLEHDFAKTTDTIDLYAVWSVNSYTITFDSNGGSNVSPITKNYQEEFDAPKAPTRKGYTFVGWFTEKSGGEIKYPEVMGAGDVTYYAHWQANNYNVIFDSNGGTPVDSLEKLQGYVLKAEDLPGDNPTSRTGYVFDGWYENDGTYDVDGNPNSDWGNKITADNITSFAIDGDDITFHARWTVNKHTVTYHVNGSVWGDPVTYKYGEAIERPADPELGANETLLGWSTSPSEALYFDFSTQGFMGDNDIDLYAVIDTKTYTINYYQFIGQQNVCVYSVDSSSADSSFGGYAAKLYGETQALDAIYAAINAAVGGNNSPITAVITYATVGSNPKSALYYTAAQTQLTPELAGYAYTVLSPIDGKANEAQYYIDILTAAGTLQTLNPDAITALIGELTGKAADPIYAELLSAVYKALPSAMGGSDDDSSIRALATYATIGTTYPTRVDIISMFAETQGAVLEDAKDIISILDSKYPNNAENKKYYDFVAENGALLPSQGQAILELISNATSEFLTAKGEEYSALEAQAYTPIPDAEGKYFDGWREEIDGNEIKNYAEFVKRAESVEDISVSAVSTSSATFTWPEVIGCYGYRVDIYDASTGTLLKSDVVRTNSFKMNGLLKGDSIKVVVTTLSMGSNGEYRAESKSYTATSVIDGHTLSLAASSLDSLPVEISYIHTVEDDIGKVSKAGDYYYITEDEGQRTYIFFTNTTYGFGSRKLEIVSAGAGVNEVGKSSTNADAIITTNETGSFIFSIDGVRTMGIVRAMPELIKSGANLQHSEAATVQADTKSRVNFESADYLGLNKDSYKVGASSATRVAGSNYDFESGDNKYYNGFKFDVDNLSTVGKSIALDRQYKFFKIEGGNRVEVTNPDKLYFYDAASDVFYFKKGTGAVGDTSNLGDYEVEITPKDDVADSYVNTFVPKAIKENAVKMARLKKTLAFTLNEGVNVYSGEGLRNAMADKNCASINIQTNIHAELAPNMYGYMDHLMDIPAIRQGILDWEKEDTKATTSGLTTGDADIVANSAIMTTEDGYGPKIFTYSSTGNVAFVDHEGKSVYYAGVEGGTLAIKSAKFTQNFDNGKFKILAVLPHQSYCNTYYPYGYKTAQMFQRVGTGNVNLEINGNYYDINAQDALYCRSANKNSFAGTLATYEIQSCHQMMFVNASDCDVSVKNMNVISNSNNASAMLGNDTKNVAEIMRFTSGGVSGFMNTDYTTGIDGMMNLTSVNVTGSLIGIYCDSGLNASFCHVKDSWANGVYAYCDSSASVSVKNSVIESSGGCAVQVDDQNFTIDKYGYVTNPTATIDYTTCTIENFVSGDEQWFKGYSMEVVALGLKSMIDNQVAGYGLTIIQEKVNPVSGLPSEYMNWEFFTRTDGINKDKFDQTEITNHPEDILTNMNFGSDLGNTGYTASQLGLPVPAAFGGAQVYSNADQSRMMLMLNLTGEPYGAQPTLTPVGSTQSIIVEIVNGQLGNMHLFFRQNQAGLGWLQGMVQLFMLPQA